MLKLWINLRSKGSSPLFLLPPLDVIHVLAHLLFLPVDGMSFHFTESPLCTKDDQKWGGLLSSPTLHVSLSWIYNGWNGNIGVHPTDSNAFLHAFLWDPADIFLINENETCVLIKMSSCWPGERNPHPQIKIWISREDRVNGNFIAPQLSTKALNS